MTCQQLSNILLGCRKLQIRESHLEHELLESAIWYTQEAKEAINKSTYWRHKKDWADGSMPINQEDWKTLELTFNSDMWNFFHFLTSDPWMHEKGSPSLVRNVKFETFRPFGFAIWSTTRMVGCGLIIGTPDWSRRVYLPFFEPWRSLLTQDERDALDRENKNLDADGPFGDA